MKAAAQRYDCAVVGAGVVGLNIALELQSHGLRCCVIDRQQPGREASWAGAGILPPGSGYSGHPALEELAKISRPYHAQMSDRIREQTGLDDGYWRCGACYVPAGESEAHQVQAMVDRWAALGIPAKRIDGKALQQHLPELNQTMAELADRYPAYHVPDEVQIRNPRLLKGILQLCKQAGVSFQLQASVTQIEESDQGIQLLTDQSDRHDAERVIIATGAWSNPLIAPYTKLRVKPVRGQILMFEDLSGQPPITGHLHCGPNYLVPRRDGRLLVGSTVEEAGFVKETTAEGLAELMRFTRDVGLGKLTLQKSWAGLRPGSSDELPLIGPASERVYLATGHFRAGLQCAPATALLLRQMLLGEPLSMDITPFRVNR